MGINKSRIAYVGVICSILTVSLGGVERTETVWDKIWDKFVETNSIKTLKDDLEQLPEKDLLICINQFSQLIEKDTPEGVMPMVVTDIMYSTYLEREGLEKTTEMLSQVIRDSDGMGMVTMALEWIDERGIKNIIPMSPVAQSIIDSLSNDNRPDLVQIIIIHRLPYLARRFNASEREIMLENCLRLAESGKSESLRKKAGTVSARISEVINEIDNKDRDQRPNDPNSVVLEMTKYAFGASSVDGNWVVSYYDGINNKLVKTVPVEGIIQSINLGVLPIRGGELLIAHQSSEPNEEPDSWAYIQKLQKQKTYIPQQADFVIWPQAFKRVFISCEDKTLPQEIVQVGMFSSKQSMLPLFTYDIARNKDVEDYVLNQFPIDIMPRQDAYQVWGLNRKHEKQIYIGEVQIQAFGAEFDIKSKKE